jgi:hypothetical protein
VQVLQWLRAQAPPAPWAGPEPKRDSWTERVDGEIVVHSSLRCSDVWIAAADGGHVEVIQWLAQDAHAPERQDLAVWHAAVSHVRVIEYGDMGVTHKHLNVLRLLRDLNPSLPWDASVCTEAAEAGQIKVLRWLRSQDPPCGPCPWDENTFIRAAQKGEISVCKWLLRASPPCPMSDMSIPTEYESKNARKVVREWVCSDGETFPWQAEIFEFDEQEEEEEEEEEEEFSDEEEDEGGWDEEEA